ncbi:hypothetical protein HOD75_03550 [archaeon]|jgi:hypothetical protein|nr:hypothetical protein [archaeon]MBT4241947.1 hypothetical protein [archaeon]MBT4418494.1 hypothetical protein [archaeon]
MVLSQKVRDYYLRTTGFTIEEANMDCGCGFVSESCCGAGRRLDDGMRKIDAENEVLASMISVPIIMYEDRRLPSEE